MTGGVAHRAGPQEQAGFEEAVGEQVEDRDSIELMRRLGAHFVQGYAVSKPRPIEELSAELQSTESADGEGAVAASSRNENTEGEGLAVASQGAGSSQLQLV
mgnify:CR=1 FL=1